MNEKLNESAQYLKCCCDIEIEASKLYETVSKKINQPESSFILGLAYDSLKSAKIIQGILDCLDIPDLENASCKKNLAELTVEISTLSKKVSKINSLNFLLTYEVLKESTKLEDLLSQIYTNYLKSSGPKNIAEEFSKGFIINLTHFKRVFEILVEQKTQHRETIVETKFCLEAKETETLRQITPLVKYQNPDAWNHESNLHAFANAPIKENAEQ
jgi:hypothetical protein